MFFDLNTIEIFLNNALLLLYLSKCILKHVPLRLRTDCLILFKNCCNARDVRYIYFKMLLNAFSQPLVFPVQEMFNYLTCSFLHFFKYLKENSFINVLQVLKD